MDEKHFKKLNLVEKYHLLRNDGVFLANRFHTSFNVSIFKFKDYYVEVWRKIAMDEIEWIEVVEIKNVLNEYLDNIDLDKLSS